MTEVEFSRKGIHIVNGLWVFLLPILPRVVAIPIIIIALIFVFYLARPYSPYGKFFRKSFEKMARKEDLEKGYLLGPSIYVLMILLLILFIDYRIAGSVFAILAFGDGFATIVGIKFGRHKIANNKSLEGSLAFFISSFISSTIAFYLINQYNTADAGLALFPFLMIENILDINITNILFIFGLISLVLTLIELYIGKFMNDNLIIPIIGTFLFYSSFTLLVMI